MKKESENMEFTGERFVPEVHGNIELEHLHRYLQACEIAARKVVLDIASGEGYGSVMLANRADKVIGVDISLEAVKHARKRYIKENLEFMAGSCTDIPLPDASVDMVVSFETIEHHDQHEKMLEEIKRVLRPTGILLISSPDKYHYSVEPGYSNPFHVKELCQHEFKQLLGNNFINIAYFGQRVIYGSGIFAESLTTPSLSYWHENEHTQKSLGITKPVYWIALASDGDLPQLSSGVLEQPIDDSDIVHSWRQAVADRDGLIASLNQTVADRDGLIASLNQTVVDRDGQIGSLHQALAERDGQIAALYNSTSWRMTRPMRIVAQQAKRARRVAGLAMHVIELGGGLGSTLKKAVEIYRCKGLSGIRCACGMFTMPGQKKPWWCLDAFNPNNYAEWIRRYDTITDETRAIMRARIATFTRKPLIAVVMPTYNPKAEWLREAIESVRQQIYPHWELCIADDASTDPAIRPILESYAREDARIKVVFRESNGHISAASNSALELVNGGEYIALLDNDDILREHALFWVAAAIVTNPDLGLIYSDEDKIDKLGQRCAPYFKSDWNPDLFLSHNMICHLAAYRTDLVKKLGGFREGYEGAQDYDLALRCIEHLVPEQIRHIPRVLYHWRSHPGSTAQAGSEKNYALLAGERSLNDHFTRANVHAKAELLDFGEYRVKYTIPLPTPLISLIIPTRNHLSLIQQCIDSILAKTAYNNYEILIVDNNSDDPSTLTYLARLNDHKQIRVLRDERPFNFSALNNSAVQQASGKYIGLVNNDIEVISPEWLDEMIGLAIQPGVGAVGARLWYPNDTLQHGGCITGLGGVAGHSHKHLPRGHSGYFARARLIQTLSAVSAACLVVKKSIYQQVGGLDETNLKVAFNDVDFCLRIQEAGYRNVWTPWAELYHHESATRGYEDTPEKRLRFKDEVLYMQKRWGDLLMNDPAYSPNLTVDYENFSYAWPPRVSVI